MALFAPLLSAPFLGAHTSADAAVSPIVGVVFDDLNGNGVKDVAEPGIDGVSLAAYDASGASVSTSVTSGGGNYSLGSTDSAAQYRVEATKPANWEAGPKGAGLTSFANGGATLDIGLFDPSSWCQSNPNVATSCFRFGDSADGTVTGLKSLISFASNTTGTVSPDVVATQGNVGSVWGLAYRPSTPTLYAAAYIKRHAGLLSGGAGAVYAVTNGTATQFATIPNVGFSATNATRGLSGLAVNPSPDAEAFAAVGMQGLGGMDISGDESTLYVVNMFDNNIYPIATATGTVGSPIALPSVTCTNGQARPFGLTWRAGSIYVGVVCDAASGTSANLSAHVVAYNGASWSTVLSFPLNYAKGCAVTWVDPDTGCSWNPWSSTPENFSGNEYTGPQPMLSSIDFDTTGAMVLGLRDRNGDRFSNSGTSPAGYPTAVAGYQAGGDLLRAADNGNGTYTLEANGTAGLATSAGAGNTQGPGGGEFYFDDSYPTVHDETAMGAVAVLPGGLNVLATMIDPAVSPRAAYTGGVEAFANGTGARSSSALVYNTNVESGTFGKANGLGDLELLCDAAPIEIGDRVWVDSDSDGVQDAGEAPLASVTVLLKNGSGTTLSSAVTDASGNYLFSNATGSSTASAIYGVTGLAANTAYSISVDTTQSAVTTPGYVLTSADAASTPSLGADERDSDASLNGSSAVISLTTGAPGQNNHSYDIGFTTPAPTYCLGNRVWNDANDNGIVDNGEAGIDSVTVTLKNSSGATVATDTTKNGGYYEFCGLAAGDYVVSITTPTGYRSSSASGAFEPAPSAETNATDNDDNGTTNGATITAVAVTLGGSAEPTGEPATPGSSSTTPDNRSNLTVDFGLVAIPTYCLGNRVWNDTNDNGIVDNGEAGRDLVTMSLYTGAGSFVTSQATANGGYYEFCGLAAGNYYVSFTTPGGTTSSSANGAYEPAPSAETNATDNDDNGTVNGATIRSATVTLGTPEPTGEPATPGSTSTTPDNQSNLTVDFGLVPVAAPTYCLGNRVWNDANDNGVVDNGESGIDAVAVNLYTSTGTLVTTDTTKNGGYYEFCGLAAGDFVVSITTPTGFTSSSANGVYEPAPSAETNATDNDDNGTTNGATITAVAVTLGGTAEPTGEPATPGSSSTTPDNQSNLTVDFGLVPTVTPSLAALGDYVWNDTNKNGIQDTGEPGVDNVTVELLDANGNPFSTPVRQVTSNGGAYLFTNLAPGDYRVRFTLPTGATFTVADSGTDDLKNSDADVTTGLSPVYNLIANEIDRSVDAGLIVPPTTTLPPPSIVPPGNSTTTTSTTTPSSTTTTPTSTVPGTPTTVPGTPTTVPTSSCVTVGDDVYSDKNRNAVRDANERGIPNATVTVTGADGKVYTATTDASGKYIVSCIAAGNYSVKVSGVDPLAKPTTPTELVPFELTVNRLDADFGFDMSSVLGFDLERQDELPLKTLAYSGASTVNQLRLISWLLALGGAMVLVGTRRRPTAVAKVKR